MIRYGFFFFSITVFYTLGNNAMVLLFVFWGRVNLSFTVSLWFPSKVF